MCEMLEIYKQHGEECTLGTAASMIAYMAEEYIIELLQPPSKDYFISADTFYYDFSVLPERQKDELFGDAYLLIGIKTEDATVVTKWIKRYDFEQELHKRIRVIEEADAKRKDII